MDQYSNLLTSVEYANFVVENSEYAQVCGYAVNNKRGLTEAMADEFLFAEFLEEQFV